MRIQSDCPDVIRGMMECGDLAALDGSAVKVYLTIKTSHNDTPLKIDEISHGSGLSGRQVTRCLNRLVECGYVTKDRCGQNNVYFLPTPSKPIPPRKIVISRRSGVPGFIYVARNPVFPGFLKIGRTAQQPEVRLRQLSDSTSSPVPFELAFSVEVSDIGVEWDIHDALGDYRVNPNKEFFSAPLDLVISTINQYVDALNAP